MKVFLVYYIVLISGCSFGQDTSNYTLYKDQLILYTDFGFNAAPFKLEDQYLLNQSKLKFKHNLKPVVGLGIHYKWFALRIGFGLPGHFRSVSKYGRSNYFDLGFQFSIKKTFCVFDLRNYGGYFIDDAIKWNDTLTAWRPNDFRPETRAASFSANVYYFRSGDIKMKAVLGRVGHYNKNVKSFYLKSTLNFFGVGNNGEHLVPNELIDTLKATTEARTISALDLGIVPGYVFINRTGHWQTSVFVGLGGVIQSKFFSTDITRGFLGLAPRVDFKFTVGYNKPRVFFNLISDFDIKSISFRDAKYRQVFYSMKLVGGYRFKKKEKRIN